jgi:hypothetical protein
VQENTHRLGTNASSAISGSHTCRWMNCAHAYAAPNRCVFLWLAIDPRTLDSAGA